MLRCNKLFCTLLKPCCAAHAESTNQCMPTNSVHSELGQDLRDDEVATPA